MGNHTHRTSHSLHTPHVVLYGTCCTIHVGSPSIAQQVCVGCSDQPSSRDYAAAAAAAIRSIRNRRLVLVNIVMPSQTIFANYSSSSSQAPFSRIRQFSL